MMRPYLDVSRAGMFWATFLFGVLFALACVAASVAVVSMLIL